MTKKRKDKIYTRLSENRNFVDDYIKCIKIIKKSDFLKGENTRGWTPTLDWLIENDTNYIKVLEGKLSDRKKEKKETYEEKIARLDAEMIEERRQKYGDV